MIVEFLDSVERYSIVQKRAILVNIRTSGQAIVKRPLAMWVVGLCQITLILFVAYQDISAQQPLTWQPQQTIPDYHPMTNPPLMIADQNRTVHAFSSQWFVDKDEWMRAIVYNYWRMNEGWSTPVDIVLSPHKTDARVTGVYLEPQTGIVHLTFWGGDNTDANIYYTKALLAEAGRALAWSKPAIVGENAGDPELASITGDENGNLAIIYSGRRQGNGLYTIYSDDGGETWSNPDPSFLTFSDNFPVILDLAPGASGLTHVVWDVRDTGGNGRQINFSSLDIQQRRWSRPKVLAEVNIGYGVLNPTIIESNGELFVAFSGITIMQSSDGGESWTEPTIPFSLTGVNGVMSFVVDSSQVLHLLWSQRITGSPDIHGAWHSVWQDGRWSTPEPIVSGPAIHDLTGDNAFDPFDVRAIISQGNTLLVTWRSDPGLKGNGVWYSYTQLNTPELPVVVYAPPSEPAPMPTATAVPLSDDLLASTDGSSAPVPLNVSQPSGLFFFENPAGIVVVGLVPVVFVLLLILSRAFYHSNFRR